MIQKLEELTRAGKFELVRKKLTALTLSRVPRAQRLPIANIARRIGHYRLALRLLNPVVRNAKPAQSPATPQEKIEYAESLRRLGALPEAMEIFRSISQHPQTLFHLALCEFSRWEYGNAIPLLRSYLATQEPDSYPTVVGKVNLAAALVFEGQNHEARKLLDEILANAREQGFRLLEGNCLELLSQLEIAEQHWAAASARLDEARSLLDQAGGATDSLFIEKWHAIADSLSENRVTEELRKVRQVAETQRHWEVVRDCDFYAAKITRDSRLLVRLYFTTPFQAYRRRILAELTDLNSELPPQFTLGESSQTVLDLTTGRIEASDITLGAGQAMHRLLILLCADFYKPAPLLSVFSHLCSGEYFDPVHSPARVHQVMKRLRAWFKKHHLNADIEEAGGGYKLRLGPKFGVRVPAQALPNSRKELELLNIKMTYPKNEFSARQAAQITGESIPSINRLLQWGTGSQRLIRTGKGPKTRYKFAA